MRVVGRGKFGPRNTSSRGGGEKAEEGRRGNATMDEIGIHTYMRGWGDRELDEGGSEWVEHMQNSIRIRGRGLGGDDRCRISEKVSCKKG